MPSHNIEPVFDRTSEIIILGSFPSPKSRELGFYYGHPQNRMWRVLSSILGCPFPETIQDKKVMLLDNHIAMWDTLQSCTIRGASDSSIENEVPNDIRMILSCCDIKAVFTTGAKASRLYERFFSDLEVEHVSLPSTSPANAACSLEKLCESYRCILDYIR